MPRAPKDEGTPKNSINLAGTMPPDSQNGLRAILDEMIADPGERRFAVCEFYGLYDKRNSDDGTHQIIVRWSRIEPVQDDDAKAVQTLLDERRRARVDAEAAALGQMPMTGPME